MVFRCRAEILPVTGELVMRAILSACLLPATLIAAPLSAQSAAPAAALPDASKGDLTASIDLGAEFPAMQGYVFTQTLYIIAPGTGRALHSHKDFPEIVRILSGTLTQNRAGEPPRAYGPGSTIVTSGGVSHEWANLGKEPVVFIATAIRRAPLK
jgi:quercetin dioxygenase-like cupin family protein